MNNIIQKNQNVDLWITDGQLERWSQDSEYLGMSIFEYIRHAVDSYYAVMHQYDIIKSREHLLQKKLDKLN